MLTSLEIENFKGFGARQRIDLAPLTLLFGANSAGKSTILHALLYLHELIEHGAADVDRTELGGSALELGGFARLVHRHEQERAITLRAEFTTPGGLERFGRDLTDFPFPDLEDDIERAWIELTLRHHTTPTFHGPLVDRATIGVNGHPDPLVWIDVGTTLREGEPLYTRVNVEHPLLAREPGTGVTEAWEPIAIPQEVLRQTTEGAHDERSLPVFAIGRDRLSALPIPGEPLRVIPFGDEAPEKLATVHHVRTLLEMVVLGTTTQLAGLLRDACYLGPLRAVPPRGFLYERAGRLTSFGDGLAAWDLLLSDRGTLVERTNRWLARLDTGCRIEVQQLFDRDADAESLTQGHVDKTVRRLLLDTGAGSLVLPSEVGAGIAQVVPVIVAALGEGVGLTMIEQPELHVHPAVQVGLGDLFIEAVTRESARRAFLVETHSEHLILRLSRRIRETTEKELAQGAPAFSKDKLSVLYVETTPQGVRVRRLRVNEQGEFMDRWPKGFFAERMQELL